MTTPTPAEDPRLDTDPDEIRQLELYRRALQLQTANPNLTLLQAWQQAHNSPEAP